MKQLFKFYLILMCFNNYHQQISVMFTQSATTESNTFQCMT